MLADLPRIIPLMDVLEILEGDTFQQSCIAQSSPAPLLTWLKDGQIITDPSVSVSSPTPAMAILVVPQVAQSHSGTYTCAASNQAGQAEESIVLVVNGITSCGLPSLVKLAAYSRQHKISFCFFF